MTTESPYLPAEVAELFPDHLSQEFWDRAARHELVFQRCTQCQTFRHPPAPICHACQSAHFEWTPVAGRGTVFSILVEFPDAPGVRLVSNLVDIPPEELEVHQVVELLWEDLDNGVSLPRFRRLRKAS